MDFVLFFRLSQLKRTNLLFDSLKEQRKPLDYDTVQELVMKGIEAGYKEAARKFVPVDQVDDEWVKYWKQQKNLSTF